MSERFLKICEVSKLIGLGVTMIKEMEKKGDFIQPIRINGNGHPRYLESELLAWMEMQVKLNREVA